MALQPASLTLRKAVSRLNFCLPGAQQNQFGLVGLVTNFYQVRTKKANVAQYKLKPDWHVTKARGSQDQDLTAENEKFVQEFLLDTYKAQDNQLVDELLVPSNSPYHRLTRRAGVLGIKIGVHPQWTKEGKKVFCTLIQVLDNQVINYTSPEDFQASPGFKPWFKRRLGSLTVGAMNCDPRMFSKAYNNLFEKAGTPPKRKLTRFLITPDAELQPGTPLTARHYRVGDYVDIQGKTIDHGFQGVVKRWGMKGMGASHGVTKAHRKMGATGGGGDKSGIWKGKKMPGHMGARLRILRGVKIMRINTQYNVLYVQTPILPGHVHGILRIHDSILPLRRPTPDNHPPMPTWFEGVEAEGEGGEREMFHPDLHRMGESSVTFS